MTSTNKTNQFSGSHFVRPEVSSDCEKLTSFIAQKTHLPTIYSKQNDIIKHTLCAILSDFNHIKSANLVTIDGSKTFNSLSYISFEDCDVARCSIEDGVYIVTVSFSLLCRLILIADQLYPIIEYKGKLSNEESIDDTRLWNLINENTDVNESVAISIAEKWRRNYSKSGLGSHIVFYDLVRMIWLHEWSHCIYGHLEIAKSELGLTQLKEHDILNPFSQQNHSKLKTLQSMEFEADKTAISTMVFQILKGFDPAMSLFSKQDTVLSNRLSILNLAVAAFTSLWSIKEIKNGIPKPPTSFGLDEIVNSSHPPAILRYVSMTEMMCINITNCSIEYGISDFAAKHPEVHQNLYLYSILNQRPTQSFLELLTRALSSYMLGKLRDHCSYFYDYTAGQAPVKFSRRLDRPFKTYLILIEKEMRDFHKKTLDTLYVTNNDSIDFKNDVFYHKLLIQKEKGRELDFDFVYKNDYKLGDSKS